jgi:hypothetical protein
LRVWKPQAGGEKWFCGECGSSLFGFNPSHADPIAIRMGTFDQDPGVRPSVRQFVGYAASWEPIPDDGLPRHAESRHERKALERVEVGGHAQPVGEVEPPAGRAKGDEGIMGSRRP